MRSEVPPDLDGADPGPPGVAGHGGHGPAAGHALGVGVVGGVGVAGVGRPPAGGEHRLPGMPDHPHLVMLSGVVCCVSDKPLKITRSLYLYQSSIDHNQNSKTIT